MRCSGPYVATHAYTDACVRLTSAPSGTKRGASHHHAGTPPGRALGCDCGAVSAVASCAFTWNVHLTEKTSMW